MARQKIEGARLTIVMTKKHLQMCEKIIASQGFSSRSTVMQVALVEKYNKLFPPYSNPQKLSDAVLPNSGLVGSQLKKARVSGEKICKQLGGESDGEVCSYFVYRHRDRTEAAVPIELLTDKYAKDQFFPNQKSIRKIQESGDVNYEI